MASAKEILTLQLGSFSNYIGAHWWNIQESGFSYDSDSPSEINHDVLYREGQTNSGHVTFTPRLIAVDLKGSLNHLSLRGDLYEKPLSPKQTDPLWPDDKVEVIQDPPAEKTKFLERLDCNAKILQNPESLEGNINSWSDFLVSRYHPNTLSIINEYEYNSTSKPFDIYNSGMEVWKNQDFQDDLIDRIRRFIEECDNFQGFHLLMDASDGFSGLGASCLQYLEDEYASKSVLVFPSIPSCEAASPLADCLRAINAALLFPVLGEHASLFVPLCLGSNGWKQPGPPREFPYLNYNVKSDYHTSAILAAALDTLTLAYRVRRGPEREGGGGLREVCEALARVGRRAAAASVGLPFPRPNDRCLLATLERWEGPLWQSLTPACSLNDDRIWVQSVTLRGVEQRHLISPNYKFHDWNPAYRCTTVQEMMSFFLSCCSYATASITHAADFPCKVSAPFPQFFSEHILAEGTVGSTPRPESSGVVSVPVIAGLHSSRSVGDMLESLHNQVTKLKLKQFHQFGSTGLESDEFSTRLENLLDFRECYHEEFNV